MDSQQREIELLKSEIQNMKSTKWGGSLTTSSTWKVVEAPTFTVYPTARWLRWKDRDAKPPVSTT